MTGDRLPALSAGLVDGTTGEVLAGRDLRSAVDRVAAALDRLPPGAVVSRAGPDLPSVLRLLATLQTGRPVLPANPRSTDGELAALARRLGLRAVLGSTDDAPSGAPAGFAPLDIPELTGWLRRDADGTVSPELGLLLSTSGSTGAPKAARISHAAVRANARSIAEALGIDDNERAPTSLPLFYSYGLSVLTSHLLVGARVVLAGGGVLSREFWRAVDRHRATSLSGVPHTYETLERAHWRQWRHPSLRTLTQAGGRLDPSLVVMYAERAAACGGRMFVMYGQTEATARMTVLPPDELPERAGSVGRPIPGGAVDVVDGEVVYRGPNVMLGYAEQPADLARGDDLGGHLYTGDLGRVDDGGRLWLTGRHSRVGKVFGVRLNLDDVERALDGIGPVAAAQGADRVCVFVGAGDAADPDTDAGLASRLAREFGVHRSGFVVRRVPALPRLDSGKIDYARLRADAGGILE